MSWDAKLFNRHLATRRFGREIEFLESVDSTNKWLLERHVDYTMSGMTVIADHQTAGRGRRERMWFDHDGHSLLFSILIRHGQGPEGLAFLSLLPAIAVSRVLVKRVQAQGNVSLKWPNDVLVNGKKVAGILAQSTIQANRQICVIGCGINVTTPLASFPADISERASSLLIEFGQEIQREILLAEILNEFEPLYDEWTELDFESLRQAWEQLGPTLGVELIREHESQQIRGRYAGLGQHGQLRLADQSGVITEFTTGDILQ